MTKLNCHGSAYDTKECSVVSERHSRESAMSISLASHAVHGEPVEPFNLI